MDIKKQMEQEMKANVERVVRSTRCPVHNGFAGFTYKPGGGTFTYCCDQLQAMVERQLK